MIYKVIYNAIYNVMYNVIVIPSSTTFRFCGEKKKNGKHDWRKPERNFDWSWLGNVQRVMVLYAGGFNMQRTKTA